MHFHNWQTIFDESIKFHPEDKNKSIRERLLDEFIRVSRYPFKIEKNRQKKYARLIAEEKWIAAGKPYYQVHPKIVDKLVKTNLDKIPIEYIEIPNNFESICLRFSNDVPIYIKNNNQVLLGQDAGPLAVRSALFGKIEDEETFDYVRKVSKGEWDEGVIYYLHLDEGTRTYQQGVECMLCNTFSLFARKNETIPQAIARTLDLEFSNDKTEYFLVQSMRERIEAMFKIAISVGFLANTPEDGLVIPDVLSKDRQNFNEAVNSNNKEKIDVIVNRSHRRGKLGWNVGTNEIFVGEREPGQPKTASEIKRELKWSHIRGGHPHAVRYGEGKKKVKIKWFRAKRIRPDLPFKD